MIYYVILSVLFFCNSSAFFYDRASHYAQAGEWKEAQQQLHKLLIEYPDNADILYDAGVASYAMGDFPHAYAYFSQASEHADTFSLKRQALFNAGNAQFEMHNLQQALECYESVLAFDSEDQYAQHNRDIIKKMLEEEKQEKQQNNNNDSQQDNNKSSDNQQKEDPDQKGDGQDDQRDQKNQSESKKNSSESQADTEKERSPEDTHDERSDMNQKKSNERQDHREDKTQANKNKANQKRDEDDQLNNTSHSPESRDDEHKEEQGKEHNSTPDAKENEHNDSSITSMDTKEQEVHAEEQSEDRIAHALEQKLNDPLLLRLLQQQEERDKAKNKQLIEAKLRNTSGNHEQQSGW